MSASHQNDQAGAELEARAKSLLGDITSIEEPKANGSAGHVQYANSQDRPARVDTSSIGTLVAVDAAPKTNGNGHADVLSQHKAFIYSLFEPTDTVCFLALPSKRHNFVLAQDAIKPEFYDRLKALNADQSIYIAMAAYKPELIGESFSGRSKDNVVAVRNLYADADHNGSERKDAILSSQLIPTPTVVMESSPGKFQFIWRTDSDMTPDTAEGLLKALASEFDTDPAVAEVARVLRVPGFKNHKYADAPEVRAISIKTGRNCSPSEFNVAVQDTETSKAPTVDELAKIPKGSIQPYLVQEAGKLRKMGLAEDTIADALIDICELRCDYNPATYKDKCRQIANSVGKYRPDPDGVVSTAEMREAAAHAALPAAAVAAEPVPWRSCFKGAGELPEGEVQLPIQGFLQEGITFIGALPGEGKSWLALSMAKSLTTGMPFLGRDTFKVSKVTPVLYLAAESGGRAFRKRCEKLGITKDRNLFLTRTISDGPTLFLNAPQVLEAVREMKPVVIIDTMIRFSRSTDENASAQNKQLVDDVVSLITAGAVAVVIIHHSTKAMRKEGMGLETVLRGTGDIAALADCVYGMLRDDKLFNGGHGPCEIEIQCVKPPRDFDQPLPFRIAASYRTGGTIVGPSTAPGIISYLETIGDFKVIRTTKAPVDPNPALPNQKLSDAEVCSKARDLIAETYGRGGTINKGQLAVMLGLNRKNADRVLNGDPDNPWSCIPGKRTEVFFVPKGVTALPEETPEETAEEN